MLHAATWHDTLKANCTMIVEVDNEEAKVMGEHNLKSNIVEVM